MSDNMPSEKERAEFKDRISAYVSKSRFPEISKAIEIEISCAYMDGFEAGLADAMKFMKEIFGNDKK